jgi:hypothetical protein
MKSCQPIGGSSKSTFSGLILFIWGPREKGETAPRAARLRTSPIGVCNRGYAFFGLTPALPALELQGLLYEVSVAGKHPSICLGRRFAHGIVAAPNIQRLKKEALSEQRLLFCGVYVRALGRLLLPPAHPHAWWCPRTLWNSSWVSMDIGTSWHLNPSARYEVIRSL